MTNTPDATATSTLDNAHRAGNGGTAVSGTGHEVEMRDTHDVDAYAPGATAEAPPRVHDSDAGGAFCCFRALRSAVAGSGHRADPYLSSLIRTSKIGEPGSGFRFCATFCQPHLA